MRGWEMLYGPCKCRKTIGSEVEELKQRMGMDSTEYKVDPKNQKRTAGTQSNGL